MSTCPTVRVGRLAVACVSLLATLVARPSGANGDQAHRNAADVRTYRTAGTPVSGGSGPGDAPMLSPGRYLDHFPTAQKDAFSKNAGRYYRVRLHDGDTPYFSATQIPPAVPQDSVTSLSMSLTMTPVPDGDASCSFDETAYGGGSDDLRDVTAVLNPGEVGGPGWDQDCPTDHVYAVQVVRTGSAYAGRSLPTELAFRVEPAASRVGLAAPAQPQANVQAQADSKAVRVSAGTGFNDAPLIAPGQYRDTATSGETRFYRVHLAWGQRLAYTLTPEQNPAVDDFNGASGNVGLTNPLRAPLAQPDQAENTASSLGSSGSPLFGSTLVPVRYRNRDSDDSDVTPYSIDGDYYLALSTDPPDPGDRPVTFGYTLVVDVVGARERGPDYARGGPPSGGSTASGSGGGTIRAVIVGVAGGVLVALALLAVVLPRRRRRAATAYGVDQR